MCQDETKTVSGSVLIGVALAFGAMFGMAAQAVLQHVGLDLASVRGDLMIDRVTQSRSALIWSTWWLIAVAALLVGPFGVVLTRRFTGSWLFRGVGLLAAVIVIGLAALCHLAPSGLVMTAVAAVDWPVVGLSAVLAALGARLAGATCQLSSGTRTRRHPVLALAASPRPLGGGGCVNSGLPRRLGHGRSRVPGWRAAGRLAVAATLALVVVAAVSAVGGAAVMGELVGPGALRDLVARQAIRMNAPVRATIGADPRAAAALRPKPVRAARARIRPAAVRIAALPAARIPAPPPVRAAALPAVRVAALPSPVGVPMSASELTFAKGYAQRRAAQDAARIAVPPSTSEIKLPAKLTTRTGAFDIGRADRHRHKAYGRHGGTKRYAASNRYAGQHGQAGHDRLRARDGRGVYQHSAGDDGR